MNCTGQRPMWGKKKSREQLYRSSSKSKQYHLCRSEYSTHLLEKKAKWEFKKPKPPPPQNLFISLWAWKHLNFCAKNNLIRWNFFSTLFLHWFFFLFMQFSFRFQLHFIRWYFSKTLTYWIKVASRLKPSSVAEGRIQASATTVLCSVHTAWQIFA